MVVTWESDSSPVEGSAVAEVTEAVLVSPPLAPASTVAPTVMFVLLPLSSDATFQVSV